MDLEKENTELKRKLQIAESWMKKEVQDQIRSLSKKHIHHSSTQEYTDLLSEEMEDILIEKIQSFFADILLSEIPETFLDNLVKSEIAYYILQK